MALKLTRRTSGVTILALILCSAALFFLGAATRFHEPYGGFRYSDAHGKPPSGGHFSPFGDQPVIPDDDALNFKHKVPSAEMRDRYESPEVWRPETIFEDNRISDELKAPPPPDRPVQPPPGRYSRPADFLRQTLVADFPTGIEDIFLMLKTGGTVMWDRLPIHLATTLTRVKNFAIYSDMAGSIAGHEVIDILKDLPQEILDSESLTSYRQMRAMHSGGFNWNPSELDFHGRNDGWATDKYKNMPMLADAYQKSPESKWFVFMDDDSYILWDNLVGYLSTMNHREPIYLGSRAWFPEPQSRGGKSVTVFAHGGSGVVISKGAMDKMFGPKSGASIKETVDKWSLAAQGKCCGDLMVAWALFDMADVVLDEFSDERPISRFQGEAVYAAAFNENTMCEPLMSFHHLHGHDIEVLWEYERLTLKDKPIFYKDLYRDFVLPYIVEEREDWYMVDSSWEFVTGQGQPYVDADGNEILPGNSKELCRQTCEKESTCYVWSYWEGTCQLQIDHIVLGTKATPDHKEWHGRFGDAKKVYTGWMVDRIRQLRAGIECDPLEYDKSTGQYNDTPSTAEGWALRA